MRLDPKINPYSMIQHWNITGLLNVVGYSYVRHFLEGININAYINYLIMGLRDITMKLSLEYEICHKIISWFLQYYFYIWHMESIKNTSPWWGWWWRDTSSSSVSHSTHVRTIYDHNINSDSHPNSILEVSNIGSHHISLKISK